MTGGGSAKGVAVLGTLEIPSADALRARAAAAAPEKSGEGICCDPAAMFSDVVYTKPGGQSEQVPQPVPEHREHEGRAAQREPAGEVAMRDAREQIEALGLAGDDFGREPARHAGEHHAVS